MSSLARSQLSLLPSGLHLQRWLASTLRPHRSADRQVSLRTYPSRPGLDVRMYELTSFTSDGPRRHFPGNRRLPNGAPSGPVKPGCQYQYREKFGLPPITGSCGARLLLRAASSAGGGSLPATDRIGGPYKRHLDSGPLQMEQTIIPRHRNVTPIYADGSHQFSDAVEVVLASSSPTGASLPGRLAAILDLRLLGIRQLLWQLRFDLGEGLDWHQ